MTTNNFGDPTIFEPVVDPSKGGTSLGNSYLNTWVRCPRMWYNQYYRKQDTPTHSSQGLEELQVSLPLLTGTLFHEALDGYYRSSWENNADTGKYDLDAGIEAAKAQWRAQKNRYGDDTVAETDYARVEYMLKEYHKTYGPGGQAQDWPDIRVLGDSEGQPLVEQDFRFELKPGYYYTGRLDAIVMHQGQIRVLEHKTTSAYGIKNRLASLSMDSQFAGELWLAQQAIPDEHIDAVTVNIVVKDRSPNSKYPVAVREPTRRTTQQIEQWRLGAVEILDQIQRAVEEFEFDLNAGAEKTHAESIHFPLFGTRNNQCTAYGKPCVFTDLCSMPGHEQRFLNQFKAKNIKEKLKDE